MTIKFKNKHTGKTIEIRDAASITPDVKCLGLTGYDVHYTDGTFNIYDREVWEFEGAIV